MTRSRPPRPPGVAHRTVARWVFLLVLAFAYPGHSLDWIVGSGFRSAPVSIPSGGSSGFVRVEPSASSLHFTNSLPVDRFTTNQIYLNGSGVCAGDFDGDGWTDLFFAGLGGQSALKRNLGEWRFEDRTEASGLAEKLRDLDATGSVFTDSDGDGDLDLLVNSVGGGTQLFVNNGKGRFEHGPVLNADRGGTSLALADFDGDGDLDVYVSNYRTETLRDQPRTNFRIARTNGQFVVALVNNRPTTLPELRGRFTYLPSGSIVENGEPDAFHINEGANRFSSGSLTDGGFLDESGQPITQPLNDWGLSVLFRDLTGDGLPDLYVCNDFASPDRFWINQGGGRFRAAPAQALRNTSKFSMGVDAADVDRDGFDDLYVLDMMSRDHRVRLTRMDATMGEHALGSLDHRPQLARSTLQIGRGDGTFAEVAQYARLEASEWAWTPLFIDIDLDGHEDLLVTTGHARDDMHIDYGSRIEAIRKSSRMSTRDELALRKGTPPIASPCLAFRNLGDLRFEEVPQGWGFGERPAVTQGACLADLDNDGDLDVAVNRLNDSAGLYRNIGSAPRVAVRLKGLPPNTRGIGARIRLLGGAVPVQSQEMVCGGRYLSGDDSIRVFAAIPSTTSSALQLEVLWRGGRRSLIADIKPNRIYEISEAEAEAAPGQRTTTPINGSESQPAATPLFVDESAQLGHRHHETPFDDFERQPLLPRRCSQAGPGVAWLDLNGDGRDDLFVSAGRGGRPGLFLSGVSGRFQRVEPDPAALDQTAVAGFATGVGGQQAALVAASAYESPNGSGAALLAYDASGQYSELLPLGNHNPGPLALADFDADGDLDLFLGGGPVGGRYPSASPSRLFERIGDAWRSSVIHDAAFENVGLVSGAVWTDLDQDGYPDLALACEWGPVRIFQNQKGRLREVTTERGLLGHTGWWTGIQSADFDGDGRLDLVVGNWGLNSRYRPTPGHPVRLYHGDLSGQGQGQVDLIEATFEPALSGWVPDRNLTSMARQLPWLRETIPTHAQYAGARVDDLLAGHDVSPRVLEASELASVVLLNRGDRFEKVPLPREAQLAPVFGLNAADFDLDGILDLFLAQNFFPVNPSISGQDAGRGLLLLGDGRGRFRALPGAQSGIRIPGEQRGSAVGDFDGDGRPDLVVSQNAADTRLFRNAATPPGLRVRIRGAAGNPNGVGSVVRVVEPSDSHRPAHEIHAGSGYRSQDSPGIFLPRPAGSAVLTVEVRGPDGGVSRHTLKPETANDVIIDLSAARP
ncbi:MAG: FG-GAP repeat domain-containing protein [Limisphaerales bacterium]